MKKLKIVILVFFVVPVLLLLSLYIFFAVTPFSVKNLPVLKDGDIVFQTIEGTQTIAIIFASGSIYTHVGIVKMKEGKTYIIEAIGPVREISLEKWVDQGIGRRISVMRVDGLSEEAARGAIEAAERYLGLPYDFFFLMNDEQIYCSELVYKAFKAGGKIELGELQNVSALNVNNFAVGRLIHERWKKYPLCKGSSDYDSCYKIIMEQQIVTPASIAEDKNVKLIYTNYRM